MTEAKVLLKAINDVKDFVNIVNCYDFECDITVGKYVVDAKSIMGIFSLDLSKPLNLKIYSDNCGAFLKEIDKLLVK